MSKENDVIEAEFIERDSTQKSKQNGFSKLWNKTKKSINDVILESKIESTYNSNHDEFTIYEKNALLSIIAHGELKSLTLDLFTNQEIKPFSIVISRKDKRAYYVKSTSRIEIKIQVEGKEYIRQGTRLNLNDDLEEVEVIKADGRYFLYKGK